MTLHDHRRGNCLSQPLLLELTHTLSALSADSGISAIILTGAAKNFCAGMDIKDLQSLPRHVILETLSLLQQTVSSVKQPLIAAVSGNAMGGGCELVLMCDIVMCTETANFAFPEVKLGLIPGGGGTQRLTQSIGRQRAMEVILTGRSWTAAEAVAWGVASRSFASYELLMSAVLSCAESIAKNGPTAVRAAKHAIQLSKESSRGVPGDAVSGLEAERELFGELLGSDEQINLCNAFLARRKPVVNNCTSAIREN